MFQFISLTLLVFIFSKIFIKISRKFNIYDISNTRSSHKGKVLTGGGAIVFFSLLLYVLYYNNLDFIFSFILVSVFGYFDDLKVFDRPEKKLLIQCVICAIFFLELNHSISFLLVLIIFLLIINTYNFMDGVNGMIGLFTLFLIPVFLILNKKFYYVDDKMIYFFLSGLLVFGYYNFRKKALIFAGNLGSMCLGFILSFFLINFFLKTNTFIVFTLIIFFFSDVIFTLGYRIIKNKNIFQAHRMHIYERLVDCTKLTHLQVALIYCFLQLIFNVFLINNFNFLIDVELIFLFVVCVSLLTVYMFFVYYLNRLASKTD